MFHVDQRTFEDYHITVIAECPSGKASQQLFWANFYVVIYSRSWTMDLWVLGYADLSLQGPKSKN